MKLMQVQSLSLKALQRQDLRMGDGFYDAVDYWTTHPHHKIKFTMDGEEREVSFVSAPSDWINTISPGEKIGAALGNMIFVRSSYFKKHPTWVPLVVAKLYGEVLIDRGELSSITELHWDALFRTIRLANNILDEPELYDFLSDLKAHERSGYFEHDEEARKFVEGGRPEDVLAAKRVYLERHRANRWVARGREAAVAAGLGDSSAVGFQNHAEMVARSLQHTNLFSAAYLVRMIREVPFTGKAVPFQIGPEFAPIAYELTSEANGKVDLIRFENEAALPAGHNKIVRPADKRKRRTWVALSKRLSYMAHKLELAAVAAADLSRKAIDAAIVDMAALNDSATQQIASANALVASDPQQASAALEAVQATYPSAVAQLQAEQTRAANNLGQLNDLARQLRGII